MNEDLVYKLSWLLDGMKSPYKKKILQDAIEVLSGFQWHNPEREVPPNSGDVLVWYEYLRFGRNKHMRQTFGTAFYFDDR